MVRDGVPLVSWILPEVTIRLGELCGKMPTPMGLSRAQELKSQNARPHS